MKDYGIYYIIGLVILVYFELRAVIFKDGLPISYYVKRWRDKSSWRRWGIAFGTLWLFYHFVFT